MRKELSLRKHCQRCDKTKLAKAFASNKSRSDGRQQYCKDCTRQYGRRYYRANAEKMAEIFDRSFAKFYSTMKGRATHLLNNARARSSRMGLSFDLTREWVLERLNAGKCEVTGIPFVIATGQGRGHRVNSFSPSIDRIDANGHYTQGNCRVVVWIYNRARGAFPDNDFEAMLTALFERRLNLRRKEA